MFLKDYLIHKCSVFIWVLFLISVNVKGQDCPKAEEYLDAIETKGHQFSYAADFEIKKCECLNGVTEERAAQLQAGMKYDLKAYIEMKGENDLRLSVVPCNIQKRSVPSQSQTSLDCNSKYDVYSKLSQKGGMYIHVAQWGMKYEEIRCNCISGRFSGGYERAKEIMTIYEGNFNRLNKGLAPPLSPMPANCGGAGSSMLSGEQNLAGSIGIKENFTATITSDDLSNNLTSFINEIAGFSDNPVLGRLAEEMSQNQLRIDEIRSNAEIFGPLDESQLGFLNMTENVMQAFAIGKAIFGKRNELDELNRSQKEALNKMKELSRKIRIIYDEVTSLPIYYTYDRETLSELNMLEQRLLNYEHATANSRLFYLKYIDAEGYPDLSKIANMYQEIEALELSASTTGIIQEIQKIERKYDMSNILHIASLDEAFSGTLDRINLYRARCYNNLGEHERAREIQANLKYDVTTSDAVKLIVESFKQKNYYAVSRYSEIFIDYILNEVESESINLYYPDLPNLNFNLDGLHRFDANYLICMGLIAELKSNQFAKAKNTFEALKKYHLDLDRFYQNYLNVKSRKKFNSWSDEEVRLHVVRSRSVYLLAKTYLESYTGKNIEVIRKDLENALLDANEGFATEFNMEPRILYFQTEIFMNLGLIEDARKSLLKFKSENKLNPIQDLFEVGDLNYLNAYLRFKSKDYKGALFASQILGKKEPDSPRIYALQQEIYKAMGEDDKASESQKIYTNLLNQQTK